MKILYVEDNEDNIYMLKNRLSRARASEMPTGGLSKRSDSQPEPMVPKKSKMPIIASSGWEYHRLRVDPGIVQRSAAPRSPGKLRKTARKCIRRCNHPRLCPVRRAGGRGYLPRPRGGVAFGQCRAHPPRPPPPPPRRGHQWCIRGANANAYSPESAALGYRRFSLRRSLRGRGRAGQGSSPMGPMCLRIIA
jgi:hypothetical protein